ncbi:MAG: thioesterase family protein [Chloroflexi bacterium]|nr:thioesterase family protein [Chloroflexota bacterium]
MSQEIQPGLIGEVARTVTPSDLASAVGSGRLDVFGTPAMLALVELAAVNAVDHLLPDGSTTVGTRLDVRHLSPSPLGIEVRARAELTAVEGRKLSFLVEAFDAVEKIAEGTHERFIADGARLLARAEAKLPKT